MTRINLRGGHTEAVERVMTSVEDPSIAGWVYIWQDGVMKQLNQNQVVMIWEEE